MRCPPPAIWIGDAIRVLVEMPRAERQMLLASLGLEDTGTQTVDPPPAPNKPLPELPHFPEPPVAVPTPPLLELLDPVERLAPTERSVAGPQIPDTGPVAPIGHRPLLTPGRDRRVLRAAFARPRTTRRLDLHRAAMIVARLQPLVPLPFERKFSLVAGSTLLLDIGAGLELFAADQADVVREVERLIGRQGVALQKFRQVPTRPAGSGKGPVWTWRPYRPPPPRTPLVIVTDLGLGAPLPDAVPAAPFEWTELFRTLVRRDIVPVVLLPYRPARVPGGLRRLAVIVYWDRDTRPGRVRRMVEGRARRER